MEKIRIILVDDHQIIRDGIKALLAGFEEVRIIAEAGSAEECLQSLRFHQADLALVDISLPGISGLKLTEELSALYPAMKVLILSMHLNETYISTAFKAGALGYLAKNTTRDELITAIREVASGNKYVGKEVSEVITQGYIRRAQAEDQPEDELLSKREIEILRLSAEGLGNKEISDKLFISVRTVESHKNHIMQRLEIKSTVDLIKFAIRNHLVNI